MGKESTEVPQIAAQLGISEEHAYTLLRRAINRHDREGWPETVFTHIKEQRKSRLRIAAMSRKGDIV